MVVLLFLFVSLVLDVALIRVRLVFAVALEFSEVLGRHVRLLLLRLFNCVLGVSVVGRCCC